MIHPLLIAALLCLNVAVSEVLVQKTFLRHLGTSLLVILITAICANVGILPSASDGIPVYQGVFTYIAPAAIFYLLLGVNFKDLAKAGFSILAMFSIGAIGTSIGAIIALQIVDLEGAVGELYPAIAGMMTATYIGGGVNYNAVAIHYNVMENGNLFAGIAAVDNIMTAVWMVVSILAAKFFQSKFPRKKVISGQNENVDTSSRDYETFDPQDLAMLFAIGGGVIWFSDVLADWLVTIGLSIPSVIILTTIALSLAQVPAISRLAGAKVLGLFSVYLFLAVIGAYCDLSAMQEIGQLAGLMLLYIIIVMTVHGIITYGLGALFKIDWDLVSVASQANIGGSGSAIALAKSLNRNDLLLPAILAGSLGYGVGTYIGFIVAGLLG
ncbi:MAG: DUF819 family protein [Cyclobacteriaceae bacterium]